MLVLVLLVRGDTATHARTHQAQDDDGLVEVDGAPPAAAAATSVEEEDDEPAAAPHDTQKCVICAQS